MCLYGTLTVRIAFCAVYGTKSMVFGMGCVMCIPIFRSWSYRVAGRAGVDTKVRFELIPPGPSASTVLSELNISVDVVNKRAAQAGRPTLY